MNTKNRKRGETTEQITLFNWANNNLHIIPCLELMYHVPNEGKRTNGNVLKAAGMKKGVPDVALPVPRKQYHGLYIEMKYGRNRTTKDQERYMELLRQQGYKTAVCYGFEEAKEEILDYLQEPGKMPLEKCLESPWIDGKCDGVQMGCMFSWKSCRKCEKHNKTKSERIIEESMANVQENYKEPMINAIANISAGKCPVNMSLEETLETINRNLAFLVKEKEMTLEQSAEVLEIAIKAYEQGMKGE